MAGFGLSLGECTQGYHNDRVTYNESVWRTHTMEAMVERLELVVDGLVQQEVDVHLDVFCE